jgi:uncharacterized protein (TIGR02300 family)
LAFDTARCSWHWNPQITTPPVISKRDVEPVVSDELGTKRTCPSCGARFYDLNKDPITCPKCAQAFVAEPLLPSKADGPVAKPKSVPKPVERDDDEDDLEDTGTLVSLDDLDEDGDDADDETAGIEDVDLGDDGDDDDGDVFLEEEEEEGGAGVVDIIGGGSAKPGDDEV